MEKIDEIESHENRDMEVKVKYSKDYSIKLIGEKNAG